MEVDEIKDKAKDLTGHIADYAETFYKLTLVKPYQFKTRYLQYKKCFFSLCKGEIFPF